MGGKPNIRFLQVNLQHSKGASDVLNSTFTCKNIDIGLLQEPYVYGGLIRRLTNRRGKLVYSKDHNTPRAAMLIRSSLNFLPLSQYITRDLVAVEMEVPTDMGKEAIVIASAYFPGDMESIPPTDFIKLVDYCHKSRKRFIMGCDANAHHKLWGSTDINKRGEYLYDYLLCNNIDIMNRGKDPTFITRARQEVLDITLANPLIAPRICNWCVSKEASLSDHCHIRFDLKVKKKFAKEIRYPKLTDWCAYQGHIKSEIEDLDVGINTADDLELVSSNLNCLLLSAYEKSCPLKRQRVTRSVPWWNKELERLRKHTRKLFNRAKQSGEWDLYKQALNNYNREIRRSKRITWRSFCEGIQEQPASARLQKVLAKDHTNGISSLLKKDGLFTEGAEETLELLLNTHFPGSLKKADNNSGYLGPTSWPSNRTVSFARSIFTPNKIKWAVDSFKPYKSPGGDGIFPALLQNCLEDILPHLSRLFMSSFNFGYIPKLWRKVNVVFIPKAGKRSAADPKSYRPISLSSFILKSMEKVLDLHIRSELNRKAPLSLYQFAYQKGKSTTTALHTLVTKLEKSLSAKEVALATFIDIEGAFDNTTYEVIKRALELRGLNPQVIEWIDSMLRGREITAKLGETTATIEASRGCPQGGVLSPLLWSVVVDDLLTSLSSNGYDVQGYADDLVIVVRGKHDEVISNLMQNALTRIWDWCVSSGLSINPSKTVIVPFTKRKKVAIAAPSLNGTTLELKTEVKYLGIILDQKLTWKPQLERILKKALTATWICRRLLGRTWGLKPKMIFWSYITVIRPIVTYASIVWWTKTNETTAQALLTKIQRLACLNITGAMSTCPTAAMEALLGLLPLHLHVQKEAALCALRLSRTFNFKPGNLVGHLSILKNKTFEEMASIPTDFMPMKYNFEQSFAVVIPDRQLWTSGNPNFKKGSLNWFTDASKINSNTGIGIYGPRCRVRKALGESTSVFQGEITAIQYCASINLNKRLKGATINIFSDSQAALKALRSFTCESRSVSDCLDTLNALGRSNKVNLIWVPGHEGIEGNEKADELAKKGATNPFVGPEPFCGVPKSHFTLKIRHWEDQMKDSHWKSLPGLNQAKRFITCSPKRANQMLSLNKVDLRLLTGLFTGHCSLKYHLHKIGKADSNSCRLCNEAPETAEHILCVCEAASTKRLTYFSKATLTPIEVMKMSPKSILSFTKSLDVF